MKITGLATATLAGLAGLISVKAITPLNDLAALAPARETLSFGYTLSFFHGPCWHNPERRLLITTAGLGDDFTLDFAENSTCCAQWNCSGACTFDFTLLLGAPPLNITNNLVVMNSNITDEELLGSFTAGDCRNQVVRPPSGGSSVAVAAGLLMATVVAGLNMA